MSKLRILIFAIVLVITAFSPEKDEMLNTFFRINKDVLENGQSYETLKYATNTIGHRLTGSSNGKKAEEYAFNLLKKYGYASTRYMPFQVDSWSRDTVSLSLVPEESDNFVDFPVVALAHSPVSSHITAKIVDCGDGLESDFEKVKGELNGKVALMNINIQKEVNKGQKNLHRSEKTALAIKFGAVGVIIANSVDGEVLLTGTASVTGDLIPIPAVCVSKETGKSMRRWIKDEHNILAVIDMLNYSRPINARNVVATHLGSSKKLKTEKIVIGGHLDSWDLATGAMDNGIGSFSVLDIARVFKALKLKTKRSIEFVMFMGEEQGLLGSKSMANKYVETGEINNVKLMMNLDMVNNTMGFNASGNDALNLKLEELGAYIQKIDASYKNMNHNRAGLHSDHQPFMLKGVPVCNPSGSFPVKAYGCYHANCDRIDLIDKDQINNNVRFTAMMLYALANMDELPVKFRNSEETRDFLIKQDLKKELVIGKDWHWEE
ncbi:MAG: M28 family peptidase [Cytophagaceae bacterium]|nr:M28 family peptidase [Cytophagaceae bacterium]MBK9935187.1 M28 family peptidase [Cytophagaceae bacterium]MBL0301630.1 M28 family peptidase [Cytophagaceae bacterium]MBL0324455.1 M28 family peptidase [Cytophagaceae bacterium]